VSTRKRCRRAERLRPLSAGRKGFEEGQGRGEVETSHQDNGSRMIAARFKFTCHDLDAMTPAAGTQRGFEARKISNCVEPCCGTVSVKHCRITGDESGPASHTFGEGEIPCFKCRCRRVRTHRGLGSVPLAWT
jgi:hypothetical protein